MGEPLPGTWIVLGFHGFVGRAAVLGLHAGGHQVYGLAHTELSQLPRALSELQIEGIVNCAGLVRGTQEDVWKGQVGFVTQLLELVQNVAKKPRLVHMSTERVNGWKGKDLLGESERWCLQVEKELVDGYPSDRLAILRPVNVFGPGARPNY